MAIPKELLHPKFLSSWIAIFCLRLVAALPFRAKLVAGKYCGLLALKIAKRRRHITETNIRLCFPELNAAEQANLVRETFIQNGIGFFEIAWSWWAKNKDVSNRFTVEGLEHLTAAKKDGKGVIIVGAHFVHLDLCGKMIGMVTPVCPIYRKNNDAVFEYFITTGRKRIFKAVLERSNMRRIIKHLRAGDTVWYSPDQDFGRQQAVFAPFFGVSAATLTTTSRLAELGNANVVGGFHYRDPKTHQYRLVYQPMNEAFPTGDDVADATLINRMIEKAIRVEPSQYMWVHRRFKTRPIGEASMY